MLGGLLNFVGFPIPYLVKGLSTNVGDRDRGVKSLKLRDGGVKILNF